MKTYTRWEVLAANIPYVLMMFLGALLFVIGLNMSAWGWITAAAYFLGGILGAFWIMYFLCPYCAYYDTESCPCGYGGIAARLRPRASVECFADKFKVHIPVIVPLWFIPPVAGIIMLVVKFSVTTLVILLAFAADAFVILPLFSTRHGCAECPQKDSCPWMGKRGGAAQKGKE
ncbi:MAG: hypothetical protein JW909_06960 [Planctomycetes bacterium]|nr:hypothetical protein [Planctomycetota bacterium]